jgi:hypothetical protein
MNEKAACVLRKVATIAKTRKKDVYADFNKTPRPLRHKKIMAYSTALAAKKA